MFTLSFSVMPEINTSLTFTDKFNTLNEAIDAVLDLRNMLSDTNEAVFVIMKNGSIVKRLTFDGKELKDTTKTLSLK